MIAVRADLTVLATGANARPGRILGLHGQRVPAMLAMRAFCRTDLELEPFIDIHLD